jgi:hypothetical protein
MTRRKPAMSKRHEAAPGDHNSPGVTLSSEDSEGLTNAPDTRSDDAEHDPAPDSPEAAGDGVQEQATDQPVVAPADDPPVVAVPEPPQVSTSKRYQVARGSWLHRMVRSRGDTIGREEIDKLRLNVDALVAQGILKPLG